MTPTITAAPTVTAAERAAYAAERAAYRAADAASVVERDAVRRGVVERAAAGLPALTAREAAAIVYRDAAAAAAREAADEAYIEADAAWAALYAADVEAGHH